MLYASSTFLRFAVVGASGVLVNLGLLTLLVELGRLHYAFASLVAIEISIVHNFVLNRRFTWRGGDRGVHTFLNYQLVSLVGLILQWAILTGAVAALGLHYLAAAAAGIGAATLWNFAANHRFTFARKSAESIRRHRTAWTYAGAAVLQVLAAALLVHSWDGFVFTRTVENFLEHGENPYATAEASPAYVYANAAVPPFAQWYAYPPLAFLLEAMSYAPYQYSGIENQMLARLSLKLPLILAALALPWVSRRWALDAGAAVPSARRLELFLLFNPLLLLIGAAWGQTEVLLGAFLIGSLWALQRGREHASGVLFGLACVVKIFPLLVYPILLAHLWGRRGFRGAARHALTASATALLVCAPFVLSHARGFFQVVILMHIQRPSGGFSPWMMPEYFVDLWLGAGARDALSVVLGLVSLLAFAAFVASQSIRSHRDDHDLGAVLRRMAVAFLGFLVLSKVVHEQYMGLAVLLLAVAAFIGPAPVASIEAAVRRLAFAAFLASLLRGLQIILLIPADEARRLFGMTSPEIMSRVRERLGVSAGAVDFWTQALGATALGLATIRFGPLWQQARESISDVAKWLHELPRPVPQWTSRKAYTAVIGAALILVPSAAVGFLFPGAEAPRPLPLAPTGGQIVGAYYEIWWRNPSNDPREQYGNWDVATTVPEEGFYSSRTGEFEEAIDSMKRAGIDFALIPIRSQDGSAMRAFAFQSEQQGLRFSVLFDVAWLKDLSERAGPRADHDLEPLPLEQDTFGRLRGYFSRASHVLESPNLLTLDGRPVVFLQGLDRVAYQATEKEDRDITDRLIDDTPASTLTLLYGTDAWENEPERLAPPALAGHPKAEALTALWSQARDALRCDGWTEAFEPLIETLPNLTVVVDDSWNPTTCVPDSLIAGSHEKWDGPFIPAPTEAAPERAIQFRTLFPSYNATILRPLDPVVLAWNEDGLRYGQQWSQNAREGHLLLYSWNAHQEGAALEPTLRHGTLFVDATARWTLIGEALTQPGPTRT